MRLLFLSNDLFLSSQLAGPANQLQAELVKAFKVEEVIPKLQESPVDVLIIDLTYPQLEIASLVKQARAQENPPQAIVAFGPHVHEGKLAAAQQAGCDQVYSRGQFLGSTAKLIQQLLHESD